MSVRKLLKISNLVTALSALAIVAFLSEPSMAREVMLSHKGLKLNAEMKMADGKKLSDGVVLITHGSLAHNGMEIIKNMQSHLAERGWNSLAINLGLGVDNRHGMYDCKVPITSGHTDALDEIAVWLKWLKQNGAKNIALMGHSRGGNQTAWFAAERPDPDVSKIVLLAPATWSEKGSKAGYKKRHGISTDAMLARAEKLVAAGKGNQMLPKTGVVYCKNVASSAAAFVSYHKPDERRNTPTLLPKIKVPVLVLAGDKDKVVVGLIDQVKPMADGKKISLKVIEDAGHYFLDFAAEDAADAIVVFLAN